MLSWSLAFYYVLSRFGDPHGQVVSIGDELRLRRPHEANDTICTSIDCLRSRVCYDGKDWKVLGTRNVRISPNVVPSLRTGYAQRRLACNSTLWDST